jgi:hypothetical protein
MEFRGEVPRIPRAGLIGSTVFVPVFHRRQCIPNEIGTALQGIPIEGNASTVDGCFNAEVRLPGALRSDYLPRLAVVQASNHAQ